MTGQPDFATITVTYVPDRRCVEMKSLKLYFVSYRNRGMFFEAAVNTILDDLAAVLSPRQITVKGEFAVRGKNQRHGDGDERKRWKTLNRGIAFALGPRPKPLLQFRVLRRFPLRLGYRILFRVLQLLGERPSQVDLKMLGHLQDPEQHIRKLVGNRLFAFSQMCVQFGAVFPLHQFQHLGRLQRQRNGHVLGIVELLPVPLVDEFQQKCAVRSLNFASDIIGSPPRRVASSQLGKHRPQAMVDPLQNLLGFHMRQVGRLAVHDPDGIGADTRRFRAAKPRMIRRWRRERRERRRGG